MLRWAKSIDWLAINTSALVLVFVLSSLGSSAKPEPSHYTNSSSKKSHPNPKDDTESAAFFSEIGKWIVFNHDGVEAASAVAVAAFTLILVFANALLWNETRKSANAAKDAAVAATRQAKTAEQALTDLEGPFLYPVVKAQSLRKSLQLIDAYNEPTSQLAPQRPEIAFTIKNYGRTAALPQVLSAVYFCGQPHDIHHDTQAGHIPQALVGPDEYLRLSIRRKMDPGIGKAERKAILDRTSRVVLRGSVIFLDIFGHRYEQTFCLVWEKGSDDFFVWGPDRNKRRRIRSSADEA